MYEKSVDEDTRGERMVSFVHKLWCVYIYIYIPMGNAEECPYIHNSISKRERLFL